MTDATPPGPKGNMLSGNLFQFKQDPLGFLEQCARDYGDVVRLRFGRIPIYMLNHPDDIEYILARQHANFVKSKVRSSIASVFGNGLFTSLGDAWQRQRRRNQPAFNRTRMAGYGDIVVAETQRLIDGWVDGETRDLYQEMLHLSHDILVKTLFGLDTTSSNAERVEAALNVVWERFRLEFPLPGRWSLLLPGAIPTKANLSLRRAVRELDHIIARWIDERKMRSEATDDLLSLLLRAQATDPHMDDQLVRDEMVTFLLTGHETSACALSWTWYLLSQHPQVTRKLAAELGNHLGGKPPTVQGLSLLPYTRMVVTESMRLYPPAWGMNRIALQACEINGYQIPAGASVAMSQWVVHRDPRYFDRPATFNPERWAGDLARRLPRYAYFPFGGGPRRCIGREFALLEVMLVVATIAQRFRLQLAPGHCVGRELSITLRPQGRLKLTVRQQ